MNKTKKKKNKGDYKIIKIGKYLVFLFLVCFFFTVALFIYYIWDLPKPEKFTEVPFIQSTKIYDSSGKVLLYDIYGEEKREVIPFDKISNYLKQAVLASEDSRFYQHKGIDFWGIIRAAWADLRYASRVQGGSTITQQLIRSAYLTKQKSVSRKIKEVVLSIELESKYSKDQIFEWYLNKIPFGENAYGVEAASQTYFNKSASDISLAEAATLAALIPAPSKYSPYGPNKKTLLQMKDIILEKMLSLGYITEKEMEESKKTSVEFASPVTKIKAPHFVMYVKKYLDDKYGEDFLKEKGLRVYTTLNWEIQKEVEEIISSSEEIIKSKNAHNAAAVVLNPKTGEILALVGSKDYFANAFPPGCDEGILRQCLFDPKYDVATMGKRQPGSAFKPIVYATAFKKGYTPDTILWDVKTEFNPNCDPTAVLLDEWPTKNTGIKTDPYGMPCYSPQDYDGKNRGPVSLRTALACSLNIPSVKLLYLAGIQDSLQTARDMGISTLNNTNEYGLSLVLGGGEVNLLEMVSAYGVFATEGNYIPPTAILKITDANGNIIEEYNREPRKVLDTQVSRQINNILSDNNARAPIFGQNSPLYLPGYQVAAKTGTTQNFVDGWTIGYTPSFVVGVWTGNNNNAPTKDVGVGITAPIWNKIMQKLVSSKPPEFFTPPDPITNRNPILLGQLPPNDNHTILFYIDKNNPLGPPPQNPNLDPQYVSWQIGINSWLIKNHLYK